MPDHLISILTPVYNPDPAVLADTISSVKRQSYGNWQLVLVDDRSTKPGVHETLMRAAASDPRITVKFREHNGQISRTTNDALALATGEFVCLLDHDDLLDPQALGAVNHTLNSYPDTDVVYSDEDNVDETLNVHLNTYLKPGPSPDHLMACMYMGHLTTYRTSLVREVGGFRIGLEGSQDWDLALRITERTDRIRHIPGVLYHWRLGPESSANNNAVKPYAFEAGRRAVRDALERRGIDGWVEQAPTIGHVIVRRHLPDPAPRVAVVIPTIGTKRRVRGELVRLVDTALDAVLADDLGVDVEIVCVLGDRSPAGLAAELGARDPRVRCVVAHGEFNFSLSVNTGVANTTSPYVLLLNDDVEPRSRTWLRVMLEQGLDDGVGAVGVKLLFEDETVQHAGVILLEGHPGHIHLGEKDGFGYGAALVLPTNHLAVTGACLLVSRRHWDAVGGFSLDFPSNYNDVDFCLKLHASGLRNVVRNDVSLFHYESSSRDGRVQGHELALMLQRWAGRYPMDPYLSDARSFVTRVRGMPF